MLRKTNRQVRMILSATRRSRKAFENWLRSVYPTRAAARASMKARLLPGVNPFTNERNVTFIDEQGKNHPIGELDYLFALNLLAAEPGVSEQLSLEERLAKRAEILKHVWQKPEGGDLMKISHTRTCSECGVIIATSVISTNVERFCQKVDSDPENYWFESKLDSDVEGYRHSNNGFCEKCKTQLKDEHDL